MTKRFLNKNDIYNLQKVSIIDENNMQKTSNNICPYCHTDISHLLVEYKLNDSIVTDASEAFKHLMICEDLDKYDL